MPLKKNNLIKLLGVALVVAIMATGLFYGLFVNRMSSSTGNGEASDKVLVVASRPLKEGTVLQPSDLKTIAWPTEQLPQGAFARVSQVAGNTVSDAVAEDEPIMASRLTSAGPPEVPQGMRAVSVHVTDSSGVLALLHAGQKVDVQVVIGQKEIPNSTEVRTAIEDLSVVSIHQANLSSQGQTLPVVTLLASPAEADVLAAADSGARIRLTLRNSMDGTTRARDTLTLNAVMRGKQ